MPDVEKSLVLDPFRKIHSNGLLFRLQLKYNDHHIKFVKCSILTKVNYRSDLETGFEESYHVLVCYSNGAFKAFS